jgi:AraC-like DNA-binding protein
MFWQAWLSDSGTFLLWRMCEERMTIMQQILKIGENTMHDHTFLVDRPSGHPVYLLLFVKKRAQFYIEGEWKETPADIAVIFKPGQKHLYGPAADASEVDFPAYVDNWMHIESSAALLPEHFPYGKPMILHNPDSFYSLFHLIHSEFYGAAPHKNTIMDALLSALLQKLLDESSAEEFSALYYQLVSLREKIYSFPQEEWTVDAMAKELHISSGYLHTVYKHYFGITCIADVIQSRTQAACELLTSTSKSVEEIGLLCGYRHLEHFVRQFKKVTGITPAKYRKYGIVNI